MGNNNNAIWWTGAFIHKAKHEYERVRKLLSLMNTSLAGTINLLGYSCWRFIQKKRGTLMLLCKVPLF